MAGIVIAEIQILDEEAYLAYREVARTSITEFEGSMLIRGGLAREVVEGAWDDENVVAIRFPSFEQAQRWYASDSYAAALAWVPRAMRRRVVIYDVPDS